MSDTATQLQALTAELLRLSECAKANAETARTNPEQYVAAVSDHFLQLIPMVADVRKSLPAPGAVKAGRPIAQGSKAVHAIAAAANTIARGLSQFAKRWRLDGDVLRCRGCTRVQCASDSDEEFRHVEGCQNSAQVRPWLEIVGLLQTIVPSQEPAESAPPEMLVLQRCDMCATVSVPDPVLGCRTCGWDEMRPIRAGERLLPYKAPAQEGSSQ